MAVADPLGHVTSAYYDAEGRPLTVTDPLGNATQETYNPLNEPLTVTDPLGGVTSATYDHDGNMSTLTDADGNMTSFTYINANNAELVKTQTDPLGKVDHYIYDVDGNLVSHTDRNAALDTFGYDPLDRLSGSKYGVTGATSQSSFSAAYDLGDRLTQVVDSAAGTYGFTYDGLDNATVQAPPRARSPTPTTRRDCARR